MLPSPTASSLPWQMTDADADVARLLMQLLHFEIVLPRRGKKPDPHMWLNLVSRIAGRFDYLSDTNPTPIRTPIPTPIRQHLMHI